MLAIQGYVDWPADLREEMRPILASLAERVRQDDGCIAYWWAEDLENAGRFRFFEAWESEKTYGVHQSADYERHFLDTHIARAIGASAMRFELSSAKRLDSEVPRDPSVQPDGREEGR